MRILSLLLGSALVAVLAPTSALAQRWEVGGTFGGSLYSKKDVSNPTAPNGGLSGEASFDSGLTFGAWATQNQYDRISGEIHYRYLDNDASLESGSTKVTFGARAHVIHYDFVYHTADREARLRPFLLAGAGVKYFEGRGVTRAAQPLSRLGLLTDGNDLKPLLTFGGGLKLRVGSRGLVRTEVRDYWTPFPDGIIAPAAGSIRGGGWLHNVVASVGIGILL